jgi:predicted MFS family arabinose efflux permease
VTPFSRAQFGPPAKGPGGGASAQSAGKDGPITLPGNRAWFALTVLCLVYALNFLDRQLLSILAKPIQDELHVTDGDIGRITGFYFALFYCVISIPVGWLADRSNRVRVLALACALWSAATTACGFARTYPQLMISRMAVGIGEAGGVPPSYAIISDYFPSGRRGAALGLFNLGPPIGQAMGIAFGASIAAAYSWRGAFLSLGGVGILMALFVFRFVHEPERGGLDATSNVRSSSSPTVANFGATCRMFFSRPVLLLVALASGATQFVTYAVLNFTTLFLMREKGMTLHQIAIYYALLIGIAVSAGIYTSGRLIDRLVPRWNRAYAYIPTAGLTLAIPLFLGFIWAPKWPVALAFLSLPTFLNYFYLSPAVALVQETVEPHQRVLSGALLLLVMNLIGLGLGPTYLGMMSDYFRVSHPTNSLQLAFYSLVPFYFAAITLFLLLARALGREAARGAVLCAS